MGPGLLFNCPLEKAKNKIPCNDFLLRSFTLFLKREVKNTLWGWGAQAGSCLLSSAQTQQLRQTHSASLRRAGLLAPHTAEPLLFHIEGAHREHLSLSPPFLLNWGLPMLGMFFHCLTHSQALKNNDNFIFTLKFLSPGPYSMNEWLVRHTANNKTRQLCQHKCGQSSGKLRLGRECLQYLQWLMPPQKAMALPAYLCAQTAARCFYFLKSKNK